ncbi:hypothetical protein X975_22958, partial [Stegodyphus mimosarum]
MHLILTVPLSNIFTQVILQWGKENRTHAPGLIFSSLQMKYRMAVACETSIS